MPATIDALHARILLVDDQQANLRLLELALRRAGHVGVASTTEPRQVCALHRQNHYDLIILDLQMPHMNGFQVMEELAKVENGERAVILVLSADPVQMTRALEAGASGFLSKPFVLAEVVQRVQDMLRSIQKPERLPIKDPLRGRRIGVTVPQPGGVVPISTESGSGRRIPPDRRRW